MQPTSSYLPYMLIPVLLGLGLAVFGGVFFFMAYRSKKESQAAQGWVPAAGRITAATMRTHANYSHDGPRSIYEPAVEYEYTVMGAPHQGHRIAFGADSFGYRQAQQVLQRYPQGSQVTVYYDPNNPAEAVLERAAKGTTIFTIVGLVFMIAGVSCGCLGGGIIAFLNAAS